MSNHIKAYRADLHIHTLLSPCGELEMMPPLIIEAAKMAGLDLIGIADHNSCENAGAVMKAAEGSGVRALPGLEAQSVEGVHLLCLFDRLDQAEAMQKSVYANMIPFRGNYKYTGEQFVVDSEGEFLRYCERHIALPTSMDIDDIYGRVTRIGGIMIPSHIDRQATGIIDVLAMIPQTPDFDALEISANITPRDARIRFPSVGSKPLFQNSDAHWLSAIGSRRTILHMEHRTVGEIKQACRGIDGRRVENA
ncbi:MAG: PHP domain-containing protein [Armatimonadota bacterium]|nr:PHP domain-containing protein [bacterium]